jgi:nucleoside-diphosphate-sugar epimerase
MRLAILGATSQIAKDLVLSFAAQSNHALVLYARRPDAVEQWLATVGLAGRFAVADFTAFSAREQFDAILNFVGVVNPAEVADLDAGIFEVTLQYDELALAYQRQHPQCRYIFLSSGAAYGANFEAPVNADSKAVVPINALQPQDWYGVAKLHAECRHRALAPLPIVDVRVFNYFSHTQDMNARFLMADVVRAIRDRTLLQTSADPIVRDFIHPSDFYSLIATLLDAPSANAVVDCYSKAPVNKVDLLAAMQQSFGLQHETVQSPVTVNAFGQKPCYYSANTRAADFGYQPGLTSIEGLLQEASIALRHHASAVDTD